MFSFIADKLNVKNLGEMLAPTLTPEQELHAAIEQGLEDKFMWLLDEAHVDPNAPNSAGNLPIHTAAYYGRVKFLEVLLGHSIDVNTTCPRSNTPLHFAASQGHEEAVKFLIGQGANPALRNRNGRTAYDAAKGDRIRQYLLPLQFRHEDPSQAAAMLPPGITPSVDPLAPKPDIAPPPLSGEYMMAPPPPVGGPGVGPPPQHGHLYVASTHSAIPRGGAASRFVKRGEHRPIQADGFGSSVGNEELTAKYGNTKEVKVTAPPPAFAQAQGGSTPAPVPGEASSSVPVDVSNPYASYRATPTPAPGGYPGYAAPGAAPSGPRAAPQFKIFNPKFAAAGNTGAGADPTAATPPAMAPAQPTYPPANAYPPANTYSPAGTFDAPAQEEEVTLSATSSSMLQ